MALTAHYIEHGDGRYHVYRSDVRGRRTRIGPRDGWPTPREAAKYADNLDTARALDARPVKESTRG